MKSPQSTFGSFVELAGFRFLKLVLITLVVLVTFYTLLLWFSQSPTAPSFHYNVVTEKSLDSLPELQMAIPSNCYELEEMKRQLFEYMAPAVNGTLYPGIKMYTLYTATRLNMKSLDRAKAILPEFTPVLNDLADFTYNDFKPCGVENESSLFVAVISAPGNFEKRKAIRETWLQLLPAELNTINLNDSYPQLKLAGAAFIIGKTSDKDIEESLAIEKNTFNDILEVGMADAYFNLSIKVAGVVNWLDRYCDGVGYVFKVDDDVFVNVRNLGSFVRGIRTLDHLDDTIILGASGNLDVARSGKWKMTYEEYPWINYPPFFLGASILISGKAIRPLAAAIQTIPYHPIDDVYLTGLCAERAGVTLYWTDRFYRSGGKLTPCFVQQSVSWLLGGPESMRSSHQVNEQIYNKTLPCIPQNSQRPVDPFEPVMFEIKQLGT